MKVITVDNYAREGPCAVVQELVSGPGLPREEAERIANELNEANRDDSVFYAVVDDDRPLQPAWEP